MKNNWIAFFDAHAPHYMSNGFTRNTIKEVDFLIDELKLSEGDTVLDIGCGTGRHSIELARRGYKVTGVDISSGMLSEAAQAASEAQVNVEWIHQDAVLFTPTRSYDAVICLCEGAFGLVGREEEPVEHDRAILQAISDALRPQGRFILTTLNAYANIRKLTQEHVEAGRFNPATMIEHYMEEWDLPEGKRQVEIKERRYFPSELQAMFAQSGLKVEHIWGGTAGNWKRAPIDLDEIEIMVVAHKV